MATPKKKHLIELMIEADVKWPEGAEYAAQDKENHKVQFYRNGKPNPCIGAVEWMADNCTFMQDEGITLLALCRNWHQTIVTREQYEKALADSGSGQVGEMPSDEPVASAMPSIEQLAANYHAKAEEAQRLQSVADNALKLADDALAALEKAGEAIGLVISIDTKPKQPEIKGVFHNKNIGYPSDWSSRHSDEICDDCGKSFGVHNGIKCI